MNTKQRVSTQRGRASCRSGCQRVGCDRISLPRNPPGTEDATNNFGIREMSDDLLNDGRRLTYINTGENKGSALTTTERLFLPLLMSLCVGGNQRLVLDIFYMIVSK